MQASKGITPGQCDSNAAEQMRNKPGKRHAVRQGCLSSVFYQSIGLTVFVER
jgi:hypothetical protein